MGERRPAGKRLLGVAALAVALYALWFLFAGQWSWPVAVWGAGAALLTTAAGMGAFARGSPGVRPRVAWLRDLAPTARDVVVEFALLAGALVRAVATGRRHLGTWRREEDVAGRDDDAVARRAWVTLLATLPPNSYVLDIDPDTGTRRSHVLVTAREPGRRV